MSPPPTHITSIALVGASGTIGSHILSALLRIPTLSAITALTRSSSTATFSPAAHVAPIDYSDPSSITSVLLAHSVDALIITLAVSAPPSTQETLIRAAAAARVQWILPNEFGMYNSAPAQAETVGDGKVKARALVEELGMKWIGITCGFWYEHSLANAELFGIDIKARKAVQFDDGAQKINCSGVAWVGRAVGKVLALPIHRDGDGEGGEMCLSRYANKMLYIAEFALSQRDMLASLRRVTGTDERDWKVGNVDARRRFSEARERVERGDRSAFGRALYTRYFYDDEGLFKKSWGLDNEVLGLQSGEVDEATRRAVGSVESGYWEMYGKK